MALWALAIAALLGPLGASDAQAAPFVDVTYDLGDSTAIATIPFIGVSTTSPPEGSVGGSLKIRYASDSASGLAVGTAQLLTFNLYVHATAKTFAYTPSGSNVLTTLATDDLHFEFLGLTTSVPSAGQRLTGGTVTPLGARGVFLVSGYHHCFLLCAAQNLSVTTTIPIVPKTFKAPLPSLTGAVGQSHTVRGTATGIKFLLDPQTGGIALDVTGTTFLVGREVQRTPVPEPATLPILAVGLAGLGLGITAWRRRIRI